MLILRNPCCRKGLMLILRNPSPDETFVISKGTKELVTISGFRRGGGELGLAINLADGVRMSRAPLMPVEDQQTLDQLFESWYDESVTISAADVTAAKLVEVLRQESLAAEIDYDGDPLMTFGCGLTASVLTVADGPWLKFLMTFPFRADATELSALRLTNRLNKSGGGIFTTIGSEMLVAAHFFDYSKRLRPSQLVETLQHWAHGVRDSISKNDQEALVGDLPNWFV